MDVSLLALLTAALVFGAALLRFFEAVLTSNLLKKI
jgi:hypothetical protein